MDQGINRSPWFLADSRSSGEKVLLLDRFEITLQQAESRREITAQLETSLNLSFLAPVLEPDVLQLLLSEQLASASEYVYGHPFWEEIRRGSRRALYAYLLETRHYLAAAGSRMAPSIRPGIGLDPLALLLSKHLLEEWDHAKFFSEALAVIGCAPVLTSDVRPIPATLEWIHLTRAIGYKSGLSAAVCSGFMEYSSTEIDAVRAWHRMIVDNGLLPAAANEAIESHVDTDVGFEHADNWKRALRAHGPVTPEGAAEVLNDVVTLAEAIYRWLSALHQGCSASLVYGLQTFTDAGVLTGSADPSQYEVAIFHGHPVWPSSLMQLMNNGDAAFGEPAKVIEALTYAFGHRTRELAKASSPLAEMVSRNATQLSEPWDYDPSMATSMEQLASSWLRAIDGHALWDAMVENPSDGLVAGYVLENYHYLACATRHIGAAIASCTSAEVRGHLIAHLEDELEHCEMLKERLVGTGCVSFPELMRPLSTTVAFVGFLENLAHTDWRAYLLVSAFLQKSLTSCRATNRHSDFYTTVASRSAVAGPLLGAMLGHDVIDGDLGHDERPAARLRALLDRGPVPRDSVEYAAIAPALAWSFLDGILSHYGNGMAAVLQRAGWRVE
jgi:pyrroloquinoline quinone (PQQ) biosynthesis protein C